MMSMFQYKAFRRSARVSMILVVDISKDLEVETSIVATA